jgi:hypothetical protein
MPTGPVAIATQHTVDVQAPGAPVLQIEQLDNLLAEVTLTPPILDANGADLSGLTRADAVVIQADEGEAELYRFAFEEACARPDAQTFTLPLTPESGDQKFRFNIAVPGDAYSVLARCSDDPE